MRHFLMSPTWPVHRLQSIGLACTGEQTSFANERKNVAWENAALISYPSEYRVLQGKVGDYSGQPASR